MYCSGKTTELSEILKDMNDCILLIINVIKYFTTHQNV